MQKKVLMELIAQNKKTCSYAFDKINPEISSLRLNKETASIGFIYRHIGELMHILGTFLGVETNVENTTMGHKDTGMVYDPEESSRLISDGFKMMQKLVNDSPDEFWLEKVETPFFGSVTRIRLFGHILYHNTHHAGQIHLTLKRGKMLKSA